jgi:hypothetical protein
MNNNQPPSSLTQLIFIIDSTVLQKSGVSYGTIDTELPEGIYKFVYTITNLITSNIESTETIYSLIIPFTIQKVYDKLREIPIKYTYGNVYSDELFINANKKVYPWSYLKGIEAQIHWANREETIDQVKVLKSLCQTL